MWIIDDDVEFDDIDEVIEYVFNTEWYSDNYDENDVDEWINECYEDQCFEIRGTTIYPSEAIKECEPMLYRELIDDWAEGRAESDADCYYREIENMSNGDYEYYNGYKVEFVEQVDIEEQEENEDDVDEFNAMLGSTTHSTVKNPVMYTLSETVPTKVQIIS